MKTTCWIVVGSLLLLPVDAAAQATTMDELTARLKKGEAIQVTIDGHRTSGAFDSATLSNLTLRSGLSLTHYPAWRVQRVTRRDSLTNGTLLGLAAGLAAGFVVALRMKPALQRCVSALGPLASQLEGCGDNRAAAFRTLTIIGYVGGTAIDGFKRETLYVRPRGLDETR